MTEPEVRQIIPASLRPKISPSPLPLCFSKEGLSPTEKIPPLKKGGQKGDLSVTSAAVIVWSS